MRTCGATIIITFLLLWAQGAVAQLSPGDLSTAHAELEGVNNCTKCHELGNAVTNTKCLDCHSEMQSLIDLNRGYHVSEEVKEKRCVECHSDHHGRKFEVTRFDEDNFDHNLTGYELVDAHGKIECRDCHTAEYIADPDLKERENTFLGMDQACLSCHEDYHQETLGEDCASCHNIVEFAPAVLFDHDDSEFPLVGAHVDVDCLECHPKTTRNGKDFQEFTNLEFASCVACHDDPHVGKFGNDCARCHNEESFTQLNPDADFDHDLTDYPLRGLHIGVDCRECHFESVTDPIDFAYCRNCHEDYHEGEFNDKGAITDCDACHSLEKPFTYTTFGFEEHQETEFPLEGAHIATPCFDCHKSEESDRWAFRNIGMECVDCHEDIHEDFITAKYYPNQDCLACHTNSDWATINFDHDSTDWPLEGEHANVSCRECHFEETTDGFTQSFSEQSTACVACHADDNSHGTQFDDANGESDCARCHTVTIDWEPLNFDHDSTDFPLEGAHADAECSACHKPLPDQGEKEIIEYKIPRFECIDCHN